MFRKMRRFGQQLENDECLLILKNAKRGVLSLLGDGGYPYGVPMNFVCDGEKIYFHCAKEGHKSDALKKNPNVSFCVLDEGEKPDDDWAYYFRSVIVFGKISVVEDEKKKEEKCRLLGRKYYPNAEDVEKEIERDLKKADCLELDIEHMTGKRVHEK